MTIDFQNLIRVADIAGQEAAKNCKPAAMILTDDKGNDIDYVAEGVCGFAWVNIKPGNSPLANFMKKNNLARSDSYYGGVTIWVSAYNQSMQRKEAYASAYAKVLRDAGFKAYAYSRMD